MTGIHDRIAKDLAGSGPWHLRCGNCGSVSLPTERQLADYLACGWPTCCGKTMLLERSPEGGVK